MMGGLELSQMKNRCLWKKDNLKQGRFCTEESYRWSKSCLYRQCYLCGPDRNDEGSAEHSSRSGVRSGLPRFTKRAYEETLRSSVSVTQDVAAFIHNATEHVFEWQVVVTEHNHPRVFGSVAQNQALRPRY
jgi:hypothetical protein